MRPKHKPKPNPTRQVYHSEFLPLEWSLVPERGASSAFAKVLVDKATDRVLGLHFCGPNAGEVIQGYAAAMKVSMRACVVRTCVYGSCGVVLWVGWCVYACGLCKAKNGPGAG